MSAVVSRSEEKEEIFHRLLVSYEGKELLPNMLQEQQLSALNVHIFMKMLFKC